MFAQLKADESFEFDRFREGVRKYISRKTREIKTMAQPLANIIKDVQDKLQSFNANSFDEAPRPEEQGEQVQMLIIFLNGNGKTAEGKGKGPNGGTGLCFKCGEPCNFASKCDKPRSEGGR